MCVCVLMLSICGPALRGHRVWNPSGVVPSYTRILAFAIQPRISNVPATCDSSKDSFVRFHYATAAGQAADFAVTPSHYVEIKCRAAGEWAFLNSAEIRQAGDGTAILPGFCVVTAEKVKTGDLLAIWDEAKKTYVEATITKIDAFEGGK